MLLNVSHITVAWPEIHSRLICTQLQYHQTCFRYNPDDREGMCFIFGLFAFLLLYKWNVVNAATILEKPPCAARSPEVNSSIESIGDGPWLLRRLDGTSCPSRRSFSISSQMIQMLWRPMHSVSPDVASLGTRSMVCFIRQGKSAFAVSHPSRQQSSEDLEMISRIAFGAQSRAENTKETSLYISVICFVFWSASFGAWKGSVEDILWRLSETKSWTR